MTPDDPELSDLRAAVEAATPRPDPAVRAAHLRLAQENFRLQAAAGALRPEGPLRRVRRSVGAMLAALTTRGALTAATALAACGVLVLTPAGQDLWQRPFAPAEREEAADPAPELLQEVPATDRTDVVPAVAATETAATEPADALQPESAALEPQPAGDAAESAPAAPDPAASPEPTAGADVAPEIAMTGPAVAPRAESVAPEPQAADTLRSAPAPAASDRTVVPPPEAAPAAPEGPLAQDLAAQATPETASDAARAAPEAAREAPTVGVTAETRPEASLDTLAEEHAAAPAPASPTSSALADSAAPESLAVEEPALSTDSYAALRQALREGRRPEAVPIGDLVNRFPYDLAAPGGGPFPTVSVLPTPWTPTNRLVVVQIGTALEAGEALANPAGASAPVARDLQAEAEWNPDAVAGTRRIGEGTPAAPGRLRDRVEAGTLRAGRSFTILFEVTLTGDEADGPPDLGTLRLRWTDLATGANRLLEVPITGREPVGTEARFAAAMAHWGLLLQGEAAGWDDAIALAESARGPDPSGLRAEAIDLMRLSETLAR